MPPPLVVPPSLLAELAPVSVPAELVASEGAELVASVAAELVASVAAELDVSVAAELVVSVAADDVPPVVLPLPLEDAARPSL
jgi:hypothetical protein